MLTDTKLRSRVDSLWDKFWTGGLANPGRDFGVLQELRSLKTQVTAGYNQ